MTNIRKSTLFITFVSLFIMGGVINSMAQRVVVNMNQDWKFTLQDSIQFKQKGYDDSSWRTLDVPHDWAFEEGISRDGSQGQNGGYHQGGVGWYRKSFTVGEKWLNKCVSIEFDGIYMNSEVWINGHFLGKRPYGYISFAYTISPYLQKGKNTIAVRVDNSLEPSARWYHPCGIYAPVHLVATNKQHIIRHGIYVKMESANLTTSKLNAKISITNDLATAQHIKIVSTITAPDGEQVSQRTKDIVVNVSDTVKVPFNFTVQNPQRWSPETPVLYHYTCQLFNDGEMADNSIIQFGIRTISWETGTGFWLNGQNIKLRGVSEHFEGGPVGGAWPEELLRWKLQLLKKMGINAIRTAHNPAPPLFYKLCDEIGIMVMDEIFDGWGRKATHDYGAQAFKLWWERDMHEWLLRDRNHPSIVIYSLGNETRGKIASKLVAECHKLDPGKPVTSGASASEFMDVYGVNGGSEKQSFFTRPIPDKPFVATEAPHTWQTRNYYRTLTWYRDGYPNKRQDPFPLPDLTKKEVFHYEWAAPEKMKNPKQHFESSYDNAMVRISSRKNLELEQNLPWYSGSFRWTGFDYYGEAGYVHGGWPFRLFMGGALDVAGFKKDLFYFYQSQWTKEPMIHILPSWTHPKMKLGTKIPVWVYSNCDDVELFLNGKSLGHKKPGKEWDTMQCQWMVPWKRGILKAIGYKNGIPQASTEQITARRPAAIKLSSDLDSLSDDKTVAIVTTKITDLSGVLYPYGENHIWYHFDGPVKLLSLENGDPVDTTSNKGIDNKKAFMGLCRAFLKTKGPRGSINITAGAIVGEKRLLTSKRVSIDVKRLCLRGNPIKKSIEIYYTTDGTEPGKYGKCYTKPFKVNFGTTVKALVFSGNKKLFVMQETFDRNLGLYWGN